MLNKIPCAVATMFLFGAMFVSPLQAKKLDIGVPGANYPAWSKLSECQAERSGEGCRQFHPNACGWEIYTTAGISKSLTWTYEDGDSANVHTMLNGRFDEFICVLWPK